MMRFVLSGIVSLLLIQPAFAQSWSTLKSAASEYTTAGDKANAEKSWRLAIEAVGATKLDDERVCEGLLNISKLRFAGGKMEDAAALLRPIYRAVCIERKFSNPKAAECIDLFARVAREQGNQQLSDEAQHCLPCLGGAKPGSSDEISRNLSSWQTLMRAARENLSKNEIVQARLDAEAARKKAASPAELMYSAWMLSHIASSDNDSVMAEQHCVEAANNAKRAFGPWSAQYAQLLNIHANLLGQLHRDQSARAEKHQAAQILQRIAECRATTTGIDLRTFGSWPAASTPSSSFARSSFSYAAAGSGGSSFSGSSVTNPNTVQVSAYDRSNGTHVDSYIRTAPNDTKTDNFSYSGSHAPSNDSALNYGSPTAANVMQHTPSIHNTPTFH